MEAPPPSTLAVLVALGVIHAGMKAGGRTHADVGLSLAACVAGRDPGRALTAQLVHLDTPHFALNALALASVASAAEAAVGGGPLRYAVAPAALRAGTAARTRAGLAGLARLPLLWGRARPGAPVPAWTEAVADRAARTSIVGYSGVIFGWFAIAALASGGRVPFIGGWTLPPIAAPLATLAATSVVLPRASLLGHVAGLLSGVAVHAVGLAWLTPGFVLTVIGWGAAIGWAKHKAGGGWWPPRCGGGGGADGGDAEAGEAGQQRTGLLDAASAEARAAAAAAAMARAATGAGRGGGGR